MKLDLNPQFTEAINLIEKTTKHLFITGKAGTGKSTLLNYVRETTRKNLAVLAPTGVAAVNVKGQTIHSFFGFKPDVNLKRVHRLDSAGERKLYQTLDTIVIDEISMVRADLIDCIDKFLRLNGRERDVPFGGVQMVFIGDLYQLPPIVTNADREIFSAHYDSPYFFSAHVFTSQRQLLVDARSVALECIELTHIYRQDDTRFIELLNAIRNNTANDHHLTLLNRRHDSDHEFDPDDLVMYLTTTNAIAGRINEQSLRQLETEERTFFGRITGEFEKNALPTDELLTLKIGAQVMMLNNDPYGRWINGTIGRVTAFHFDEEEKKDVVVVELHDGTEVDVLPARWEMFTYTYDKETKQIDSDIAGSFIQYPLKLAWAVTIHKSQGKTFDRVLLDIGSGTFSPGQLYVALSRCTSLEGIVLKQPIERRHIWTDRRVMEYVRGLQNDGEIAK